ncbi:hypothetical protein NCTGTJJY_CDS0232 [Serratia phage 92A1]|nr:hypothetical protein NCTGTJJY_CDS0232 [Serratia phage 92A1]
MDDVVVVGYPHVKHPKPQVIRYLKCGTKPQVIRYLKCELEIVP